MRYYTTSPTNSNYHPDSIQESKLVEKLMKHPDLLYFEMSDENLLLPFEVYLKEKGLDYNRKNLENIINQSAPIILAHKNFYNRPRPAQVNPNIKPVESSTAKTPSYPAGHSFQSYLVAKHLGDKHPSHQRKFNTIADRIGKSRTSMGLHYPSDHEQGRNLANLITSGS
jgi:hypothetical protein